MAKNEKQVNAKVGSTSKKPVVVKKTGAGSKKLTARVPEASEKTHFFSMDTYKDMSKKMSTPRARKIRKIIFWSTFIVLVGTAILVAFFVESNDFGISKIYNFLKNSTGKMFSTLIAIITVLVVMNVLLFIFIMLSKGSNRRKTILAMVGSFTRYVSYIILFGWILAIWGVNVTSLLLGAGIIGLVIGFGAQSLIGDILAGVFIVFENNVQVGDIITFKDFRGEVIEIGVRTTKVKSHLGDINVINNSELRNYVNMSKVKSVAVCYITVSYGENLAKVEKVIRDALPAIKSKLPAATAEPKYVGPTEFSDRGTVLRIHTECNEVDRLQLVRDVNRELKLLFDKNKIKVAVPQVEVTK